MRPDVGRRVVADRAGVDLPHVEPGRFANLLPAQGDHGLQVKAVERDTDSTTVSPAQTLYTVSPPQTLYTTLLSGAAFEAYIYIYI